MEKPELMLLAWLAGVGSAAGLAYWFWQRSLEAGDG